MYRVVVVEDETIVRKGIVRNTDWGSVDCMVIGDAGNGEEGLALIRKLRPDLVITAIRMPNPRAADGKERLLALDIAVKEQENALPGWDDDPCGKWKEKSGQ